MVKEAPATLAVSQKHSLLAPEPPKEFCIAHTLYGDMGVLFFENFSQVAIK